MNASVATQLFKTCVLPALEYGIGLWGAGNYNSATWASLESFWRMAARTILGVPVRTPNAAVLGDLGWTNFWVRGAWQAVCLWERVTRMNDDALARKAMHVQLHYRRDYNSASQLCVNATLRTLTYAELHV